ncbi:MAG: PilZ domain-containing protein [Candidatus Omnitrophica bacterium]|nr:PilZ domain-containing protein [Candidatus Omnitrophota bacterium]
MTYPSSDRRRATRFHKALTLHYRLHGGEGEWKMVLLANLSTNGARFMSEDAFEVDTLLECLIGLPSAQRVEAIGRVVWNKKLGTQFVDYGVQFKYISAENKEALRTTLEELDHDRTR